MNMKTSRSWRDNLVTLKSWGRSEDRDPYYADLSRIRFETALKDHHIDETMLSLAIRYPFSQVRSLADNGELSVDLFQAMAPDITSLLVQDSEAIFETYLDYYRGDFVTRKNLSGYFGEVSFLLLMLRAANNRDIITLPSKIHDDITAGVTATGKNLSIDAQVYTPQTGWQNQQIKSTAETNNSYAARVIQPPELPLKLDPELVLPLNIFYDFLDIQEGTASTETIRRVNLQAASLAKTFGIQ